MSFAVLCVLFFFSSLFADAFQNSPYREITPHKQQHQHQHLQQQPRHLSDVEVSNESSSSASSSSVAMRGAASSAVLSVPSSASDATATEEEIWQGGQSVSALTKDVKKVMDVEFIRSILPHRYPFLLVDKVIEFEAGKRAVGVKTISVNEPQFTGHFPHRAIMPGVLQVEAMAQLGGLICLQAPVSDGKGDFFFAGVDGVRWKRPVVPGDVLVMEMELVSWKEKFGIAKMRGNGYVDGAKAIEVKEFTFALAK